MLLHCYSLPMFYCGKAKVRLTMQINHFHISLKYVPNQQDGVCHGEMDKAPASYSGGYVFISLFRDRLCSLEILYIFPQFILVIAEILTCLSPRN
jgi:hypothetical protein